MQAFPSRLLILVIGFSTVCGSNRPQDSARDQTEDEREAKHSEGEHLKRSHTETGSRR